MNQRIDSSKSLIQLAERAIEEIAGWEAGLKNIFMELEKLDPKLAAIAEGYFGDRALAVIMLFGPLAQYGGKSVMQMALYKSHDQHERDASLHELVVRLVDTGKREHVTAHAAGMLKGSVRYSDCIETGGVDTEWEAMSENSDARTFAYRIEDNYGYTVAVVKSELDIDKVIEAHGKSLRACTVYGVLPNGDEYIIRNKDD